MGPIDRGNIIPVARFWKILSLSLNLFYSTHSAFINLKFDEPQPQGWLITGIWFPSRLLLTGSVNGSLWIPGAVCIGWLILFTAICWIAGAKGTCWSRYPIGLGCPKDSGVLIRLKESNSGGWLTSVMGIRWLGPGELQRAFIKR